MSPTLSRVRSVALVVATLVVTLVVLVAPVTATPIAEPLPVAPARFTLVDAPVAVASSSQIDSCRMITEPGRYALVADLESHTYTCLVVAADDVVLDGQGHTLTVAENARAYGAALGMPTPDQFDEAVVVSGGRSNVTVTNLSFAGFDTGVRATGGSDLSIVDVTGRDAVTGVALDGVARTRVVSTTIGGKHGPVPGVGPLLRPTRLASTGPTRTDVLFGWCARPTAYDTPDESDMFPFDVPNRILKRIT